MSEASVGDDVYGEDPTVNALEKHAADMFGKPAAIFASSGTQTNLLGILSHCTRGDEYIVGSQAHTFKYEGGGAATLGGVVPNPIGIESDGTMPLKTIQESIRPKDDPHFATTKLVCLENTFAGQPLPTNYATQVSEICSRNDLSLHLDGARIFNAAIANNTSVEELTQPFDSVSICLSKGLGAPIGSILLSSEELIKRARRWRKVLGGGMRQAGIIAAAGMYALENNIETLSNDHEKAAALFETLKTRFGEESITCFTNMLHLNIGQEVYTSLASHLVEGGIRVGRPRWVLHKDVSNSAVTKIKRLIGSFKEKL